MRLLEAVVAEPDRAIGCLDILAPDERAHLLESFNATTHAREPELLPALFGAQVAARPDGGGGVRGRVAELPASSTRAPISWRIICARWGLAPRWWSGCASSARST